MNAGQERRDGFREDKSARTQKPYLAQVVPKPYIGGGCENPQKFDSGLALFLGSTSGVCDCPLPQERKQGDLEALTVPKSHSQL